MEIKLIQIIFTIGENMNKIILIGRLTKNPETRYSQSANPIAVTRCSIAINRPFAKEGEQNVDFFNVVAFGKKAEFFEKYGSKGRLTSIIGRMQQNTWEDNSHVKHTSYDVLIEEINFLDKVEQKQQQAPINQAPNPGFYEDEDDLPF